MVRTAPLPPPDAQVAESAALRRWREQETAELPPAQVSGSAAADAPLPSGWWILPVLLLSCLAWGALGAMLLR